ncbi:hypothetical protein [Pseudoalteromonas phage PH357]|nr:hypothetical protein [Pseudoalteromonas phage PH357]
MNPEQLSDEIQSICSYNIDASVYHNRGQGITISLDGEFNPRGFSEDSGIVGRGGLL